MYLRLPTSMRSAKDRSVTPHSDSSLRVKTDCCGLLFVCSDPADGCQCKQPLGGLLGRQSALRSRAQALWAQQWLLSWRRPPACMRSGQQTFLPRSFFQLCSAGLIFPPVSVEMKVTVLQSLSNFRAGLGLFFFIINVSLGFL